MRLRLLPALAALVLGAATALLVACGGDGRIPSGDAWYSPTPRSAPEGFSEASQSRWPASMTSWVQRAASAAPVENSPRSRSPVTARS